MTVVIWKNCCRHNNRPKGKDSLLEDLARSLRLLCASLSDSRRNDFITGHRLVTPLFVSVAKNKGDMSRWPVVKTSHDEDTPPLFCGMRRLLMHPETCCVLVEKTVSDIRRCAGLDRTEKEHNTFMTELDQLKALTLQANHGGQDSRSRQVEQAEEVVDGSDSQRLFDNRLLLPHRGLPARKYDGSYSRCNEAAVDEGAATNEATVDGVRAALPDRHGCVKKKAGMEYPTFDGNNLAVVVGRDGVNTVFRAMRTLQSNREIQLHGLEIICRVQNASKYLSYGVNTGVDTVWKSMRTHNSNNQIQLLGCKFLIHEGESVKHFVNTTVSAGALDLVLAGMSNHDSDANVQISGMKVIHCFDQEEGLASDGGIKVLATAMTLHRLSA